MKTQQHRQGSVGYALLNLGAMEFTIHAQFTKAVTAGFCGQGEGRSVLGLTLPGAINSYSSEEFLLKDPPHNLT